MRLKKINIFFLVVICLGSLSLNSYAENAKNSLIIPETTRENPKYTIDKIKKEIAFLSKYIGTYPPVAVQQDDKQKIYDRWSDALVDANAHLKNEGATEEILSVLSELFREGHNLDVQGAGSLAKETIDLCLSKYDSSLNCNFSAMRFYLSVDPTKENVAKAKKSVDFLTNIYSPDVPAEVVDAKSYLSSRAPQRSVPVVKEVKKSKTTIVSKTKVAKKKVEKAKPVAKKKKGKK